MANSVRVMPAEWIAAGGTDVTDDFVRLSIGTESDERIWEALQVIRSVLDMRDCEPIDPAAEMKQLRLPQLGAQG